MTRVTRIHRRFFALAPLLSAASLLSFTVLGDIYYVDADAGGSNTGTNWINAYTNLQTALAGANSGDQIWVASGTYKPTTGTNRNATFQMREGVDVYGGFSGAETNLSQRNPATNVTILSGDLNGDDAGFSNNTENVHHVVTGVDNGMVAGFTISGGNAGESEPVGGGVFCPSGGTVSNCVVTGNYAEDTAGVYCGSGGLVVACTISNNVSAGYTGGVRCDGGGTVRDCLITGNSGWGGGGAYCWLGGVLDHCTLVGNAATSGDGGGVYTWGGTVTNCTLVGNTARVGGGVWADANTTIRDCTFIGNSADSGGGAFCMNGTVLYDCTISNNSATIGCGGVWCYAAVVQGCTISSNSAPDAGGLRCGSNGIVTACTIVSNSASSQGGGAYVTGGVVANCAVVGNSGSIGGGVWCGSGGMIRNCNIVSNSADAGGGVYAMECTVISCIIYYNTALSGSNCVEDGSVSYCASPDLTHGTNGNITSAPQFMDLANMDYHLRVTSPCIDAGASAGWAANAVDFEGNPRIFNGKVDMGIHEWTMGTQARAMLAGTFVAASNVMQTVLQDSGKLPATSPYDLDVRSASAVPTSVTDWIMLELLETNALTTVEARSVFLRSDGQVINDDGSTAIRLECHPGHYYLVAKHRNHLAVMSAQPLAYTNALITYDFTTNWTQYRGGTNACVELEPGVWGMIAGDADGDGKITHVDRKICEQQQGQTGYKAGDFNLDGVVDGRD